ncbi:MAG: 1-acyl-sn-glycerol-3-phosphate acyltransferase [Clostridiales bacterium]|nr:1-acyl-sn-glycerol-3-phosphate acyltransferase [Clostridiales bacterium]
MKNKKGKIFSFKYFLFDFVRVTGAIPALVAYRVKKLYVTPAAKKKIKGGAILASNHIGFFDVSYLMTAVWYRRLHFVTIKEVYENKWSRMWFKHFTNVVAIDRENTSMSSMREIVSLLNAGKVVGIFPEGHINENDATKTIGEYKSGAVLMAIMSGKPIIPVYISPRKSCWERIKIVFGEPIYVDEEERKKSPLAYRLTLAQLLYDREKELQEFCERKYGKRN